MWRNHGDPGWEIYRKYNKISNIIQNKKGKNLSIKIDSENEVTTTFDYLEVNYNLSNCINDAFNIGRSSNIFKNNFEIFNLLFNKKNIYQLYFRFY